MRVILVGGTGPVGQSALPHLLAAGHSVAVAHSGAHEPPGLPRSSSTSTARATNCSRPVGRSSGGRPRRSSTPSPGGATAAKARQLGELAERCGARRIVAVSSMDVYRHCAVAGVDGHAPLELPLDALPLPESAPRRSGPSPGGGTRHDNVAMEDALHGAERDHRASPRRDLRPVPAPARVPRVVPRRQGRARRARAAAPGRRHAGLPPGRVRARRPSRGRGAGARPERTLGVQRRRSARLHASARSRRWWPSASTGPGNRSTCRGQEGDHPWNVRHPVDHGHRRACGRCSA